MSLRENNDWSLVLASASPRRKSLLQSFGLAFTCVDADADERVLTNENPETYVQRVALLKAQLVAARSDNSYVIGADTTVVVDDVILSKPLDLADAKRMLRMLSGRAHRVLTALVVLDPSGNKHQCTVQTTVRFVGLTANDINAYCASGEPFGKAGSYAIQGFGARFVESIDGSYSAVVGLPLCELRQLLLQVGIVAGYGELV